MTRRPTLFLACLTLLAFASLADACPGCKESIAESLSSGGPGGPTPGLPSGFNYSIYFMFAGLFSVLGLVMGIVVKGVRSAAVAPGFAVKPVPQPQRPSNA